MDLVKTNYKEGDTAVLIDPEGAEHMATVWIINGKMVLKTSFGTRHLEVFEDEGYHLR